MALSVAEYNRIVDEWMRTHFDGTRPCPLCGTIAGWRILPLVEMPVRSQDLEGQLGGKVVPLVPLMCRNCAYTAFFGAVPAGVLPPDSPAGQTGETA